jgi:DNA sulfur modification protein DndB
MKIPAIRAKIGDWTYYITTLTFQQISENVEKIDDEIYSSDLLKDLLQRSITDNYIKIKEYIVKQEEMFFNSLVLAVYDDYPDWISIEMKYDDEEHYDMGLLNFPGNHKIIPVDGQHRVEGIKAALEQNQDLAGNKIGAIFIGHKDDEEGKQRTRRLFTTLNRYAKPVSTKDIIALDEDDVVAIATRSLVEDLDHPLFSNKRIIYNQQKAIPDTNKTAFTSIISLYQCNVEIFKQYQKENDLKPRSYKDYLRFRPTDERIENFQDHLINYWDNLTNSFEIIEAYNHSTLDEIPQLNIRNRENGGNLLFRPVGIEPFVQATTIIKNKSNQEYEEIIEHFSNVDFTLNQIPWKSIVWNDLEKTMIMGSKTMVKLLLLYMFGDDYLTDNQLSKLKEKYASKLNRDDEVETILDEVPRLI